MISKINLVQNNKINYKNNKEQIEFKGATGSAGLRFLDAFVKSQENLSSTRFIQDTATNWLPKALLSRSKADFWEFTFLEFLESGLFYYAAPFFGEHLFRKGLFKAIQPKNLKEDVFKNIPQSLEAIKKSNLDKSLKNRLITTKSGMVLACLAVPVLEYALSFAKNLFTLKVFKVSDFNNIANLNKDKKEDKAQQNRVEKHAKKELVKAGILSVAGVGAGLALAAGGHKSEKLVKLSEGILEPGEKLAGLLKKFGLKSPKFEKFLKEYMKLDFESSNGKLALSKGQLAVICTTGLFGYSNAAKDRGKLDFYEVWTRVPLVVLYTIFGSSIFDAGFKNILIKKGKFPELVKKDKNGFINIPARDELPKIAEKLAKKNNTTVEKELNSLIKQKAIITGVPYAFGLAVMGFTLSAVTRIWTKYRYKHQVKNAQSNSNLDQNFIKMSPTFEGFRKQVKEAKFSK